MDKRDLGENEHQNNNGTTEESNASVNNNEGLVQEAASTSATGDVNGSETPVFKTAEPAETPVVRETERNVPVMNKVGAGAPPPSSSPKAGKGWMIASIVLAVALIIVLIKPPFQKEDNKTAVATVNGTDITKAQLYDKLIEAGGEATLKNLITTTLVDQEAKKANVTVTDEDLNAEIEDLKTQLGGEEALNAALSQSNMTLDDLKKQMPMQVKIRKLIEPKVTVTEKDISAYYDENKASFNQQEEVRASHILVATKAEADSIVKQLKEGADFAKLAKEKSTDTASKENGGDLNFFKRGDMVAEFSDVAFKLKVGETSGAVKSDFGYHIIKVTDRKEAKEYTLEEKKAEIEKTLKAKKVSEMSNTWLSELNSKAKITNSLTDAKESAPPETSAEPSATEAPPAK
ncbi:peptidylprolyl isomerase [Paenibacillus sp. FSL L8-0470]|uniref:peptidylprolyl isomerase n=1 Tax=Paenibacillus sp. FSL L8-0470 TaxID=2954688 RepID=UPI0030FB2328